VWGAADENHGGKRSQASQHRRHGVSEIAVAFYINHRATVAHANMVYIHYEHEEVPTKGMSAVPVR
jgi:hypothetical protein